MSSINKPLRLIFPQWQGGDNPPYYLGSQLLAWLSPDPKGAVEEVPVPKPTGEPLQEENGIVGRSILIDQLSKARQLIEKHTPDSLVVLGGDCLVSLAPFSWLLEKYKDKLGILWIDSHPDVQTPKEYKNAHAHVLGELMGNGDSDFTRTVKHPVSPQKIMIAGIHDPLPYEANFISEHKIQTCSPEQVRSGAQPVLDWIKNEKIEYLAIHIDLDVLDPHNFRSVLFAKPGRGQHDFGDVAEGKLNIPDVVKLANQTASISKAVGLTIAEHLPWDALNLKNMLEELPLIGK
ncbi:arginase [Zymomonas mobilis]|uniref:arginase family protein n=1 Tax=Zymomonas mobilis TaxID=542 RepID=UPI000B36A691|nr:arginase family protein [Zymomonas mobilis]ART93300.1 arginase [Zymomonas mobilis subsp. mobilis]TWD59987.1 arginase [Zymomonas mobilis]